MNIKPWNVYKHFDTGYEYIIPTEMDEKSTIKYIRVNYARAITVGDDYPLANDRYDENWEASPEHKTEIIHMIFLNFRDIS
jgi:hypothetical protein